MPVRHLLLISGEAAALATWRQHLAGLDLNLVQTGLGSAALQLSDLGRFALIILDTHDSREGAFYTAGLLRADERTRQLPLLTVVPVGEDEIPGFGEAGVGVADILYRPVKPKLARAKILALIGKSPVGREKDDSPGAPVLGSAHVPEVTWAALLEGAQDGVLALDGCGRVAFANAAAARWLGYPLGALVGLPQSAMVGVGRSLGPDPVAEVDHWIRYDGTPLAIEYTQIQVQTSAGAATQMTVFRPAASRNDRPRANTEAPRSRAEVLTAIIQRSPIGVAVVHTGDGRVVEVNPAWLDLLGYERSECLGRALPDLPIWVSPQDWPLLRAELERFPRIQAFETRLHRQGGGYFEASISGERLELNGQSMFVIHLMDVTDRKNADTALQTAHVRLHHLLASGSTVIYSRATWEAYALTFVSDNVATLTGYTAREFVDDPAFWAEHVHPADRAQALQGLSRIVSRELHSVEYRFQIRGREYRWLEEDVRLVHDAITGQWEMAGAWSDITERKLALESVHESYLRFTQIAQTIREIFWMYDQRQQRVIYINPAFESIWGRPLESVYQGLQAYVDGIHPADQPAFWAAVERQARGERTELEYRVVQPDGTLRWLHDRSFPIWAEDGQLSRTTGIAMDITERKQAEATLATERASLARRVEERTADLSRANAELAHAVRVKDEFLANVSHELRTPLTSILAFSEGLLEQLRGPLNERQQEAVRNIDGSGRHLLALINDILDLAKAEAGRLTLAPEVFAITDACEASLSLVLETARRKNQQLEFHTNDPLAMMQADPRRLKQILVNLLSNAVKFTPAGGRITLQAQVRREAAMVEFVVEDNGMGIAAEDLERLFSPFTQVAAASGRQPEGTGLGLVMVRRLAEMHGGSVEVTSVPGQGSRFSVKLPYSPAPNPDNPVSPATTRPAAADELVRALQEWGLSSIIPAADPATLSQALEQNPGAVFIHVPSNDDPGWGLLDQLCSNSLTRPPVILFGGVEGRQRGLAAGAVGYITLPVSSQKVQATLTTQFTPEVLRQAVIVPSWSEAIPPARRILLAEDNEINIVAMGDFLEAVGYEIVVARNGLEAVDLAARHLPDLVLMDIQMPELDGLEAIRQLRAHPAHAATPIIALTALAMPGDRERCLAAGASDYLAKPVGMKRLLEVVRERLQ